MLNEENGGLAAMVAEAAVGAAAEEASAGPLCADGAAGAAGEAAAGTEATEAAGGAAGGVGEAAPGAEAAEATGGAAGIAKEVVEAIKGAEPAVTVTVTGAVTSVSVAVACAFGATRSEAIIEAIAEVKTESAISAFMDWLAVDDATGVSCAGAPADVGTAIATGAEPDGT